MKKKTDSSEVVTKGFFRKELKRELKKELSEEIGLLTARIQLMLDQVKNDISQAHRKELYEFRTEIDPILKEVLTAREDRTITTEYITELQQKVGNHEKRIKNLEEAKIAT